VRSYDDHSAAAVQTGLNDPATTWTMIDHQTAGMNRSHTAIGTEPRFCAAARPETRQLAPVSRVEFAAIRGFVDGTAPLVALRHGTVRRSKRLGLPFLGPGMLLLGLPLLRGSLPLLGRDMLLLGRRMPLLGRGLPLLGGNLPLLRRGLPLLGGNLPLLGRGLPLLGGNLPLLRRGLPLLRGNLPLLRRGLPLLGGDLPLLGRGLVLLGGGLVLLGRGLPLLRCGMPRFRLLLLIVLSPGRSRNHQQGQYKCKPIPNGRMRCLMVSHLILAFACGRWSSVEERFLSEIARRCL